MTNSKTTIAGILTLLATLFKFGSDVANGHPIDFGALLAGVTAGAGLIAAKDHNVTGGSVSQPTVENPPTLMEKK